MMPSRLFVAVFLALCLCARAKLIDEVPVCYQPRNAGPCKPATLTRWFYNVQTRQCESFLYGGCRGNLNNFETEANCKAECVNARPLFCEKKPDSGPCDGYEKRWFYSPLTKKCERFTYGGCGGNKNNFASLLECQWECRPECKTTYCFVDPCSQATCAAHPKAECVSNYCNGCTAEFFVENKRVDCGCFNAGKKCDLPSGGLTHQWSIQTGGCCKGLQCCPECGPPVEYLSTAAVYVPVPLPKTGYCKSSCHCPRG